MVEIEKRTKHMIVFKDGSVEFTPKGIEELGPLFNELGTDIRSVTTKEQADRLIDQSVATSAQAFLDS